MHRPRFLCFCSMQNFMSLLLYITKSNRAWVINHLKIKSFCHKESSADEGCTGSFSSPKGPLIYLFSLKTAHVSLIKI